MAVSSQGGTCSTADYDASAGRYTIYFDEDRNPVYMECDKKCEICIYSVKDRREELKPDVLVRLDAIASIGQIFRMGVDEAERLLLKAYENNDDKQTRIQAGKELGYSNLKIKLHEKLRFH